MTVETIYTVVATYPDLLADSDNQLFNAAKTVIGNNGESNQRFYNAEQRNRTLIWFLPTLSDANVLQNYLLPVPIGGLEVEVKTYQCDNQPCIATGCQVHLPHSPTYDTGHFPDDQDLDNQ
jgi:hypothetical protein